MEQVYFSFNSRYYLGSPQFRIKLWFCYSVWFLTRLANPSLCPDVQIYKTIGLLTSKFILQYVSSHLILYVILSYRYIMYYYRYHLIQDCKTLWELFLEPLEILCHAHGEAKYEIGILCVMSRDKYWSTVNTIITIIMLSCVVLNLSCCGHLIFALILSVCVFHNVLTGVIDGTLFWMFRKDVTIVGMWNNFCKWTSIESIKIDGFDFYTSLPDPVPSMVRFISSLILSWLV